MNRENDKELSRDPDERWARAADDLRSYREEQRRAWGDIDESMIARYLIGTSREDERERIWQAIRDFPKVRECVEILEEVMGADQDEASAVRSQPKPPRLLLTPRWRLVSAIAAGLIMVIAIAELIRFTRSADVLQPLGSVRQSLRHVSLPQGFAQNIAFSRDGRLLASASDGSVRIWDAATGEPRSAPMRTQTQVSALAFSWDGKYLMMREGGQVGGWEVGSGTPLGALRPNQIKAVERELDINSMADLLWRTKARRPRLSSPGI